MGEGAQREQEKGTRTEGAPSFAEAVRKHCFPGPNPSGHVLGEEELVIACGLSKKMSLSWYSAGRKILKALLGGGEWRGTPTKSKHSFSFYMGRRVLEKDKLIFVTRCGAPMASTFSKKSYASSGVRTLRGCPACWGGAPGNTNELGSPLVTDGASWGLDDGDESPRRLQQGAQSAGAGAGTVPPWSVALPPQLRAPVG